MKDEYLIIHKIVLDCIKKLTDRQYKLLLEGKGKLYFKEITKKEVFVEHLPLINQYKEILLSFEKKEQGIHYLNKLKKKELAEIAQELNIRLLKSDTKIKIINKIIDLVFLIHHRKNFFQEINKE